MKFCVVLNASAGSLIGTAIDKTRAAILAGFEAAGAEVEIRSPEGPELVKTLDEAAQQDFDAVIVGGGDGTIATAAGILAKHDMALGVLPLGTMNMLARDLSLPLTIGEAVASLASGAIRRIDMGEVNGDVFLCNSSLGVVPMIGVEREKQRGQPWLRKVSAIAGRLAKTLYVWPGHRLRLVHDGISRSAVTRSVTISNNEYSTDAGGFLSRTCLDGGKLTVYLSCHKSRMGFMLFSIGVVLKMWKKDPRLDIVSTDRVAIHSNKRALVVCNDGEMKRMRTPLDYKIMAGALKVLAPSVPAVEAANVRESALA